MTLYIVLACSLESIEYHKFVSSCTSMEHFKEMLTPLIVELSYNHGNISWWVVVSNRTVRLDMFTVSIIHKFTVFMYAFGYK